MYVRKEAAYSTEIEGTKATLADAIKADAGMKDNIPHDVETIIKYMQAMKQGLNRLYKIPLSNRLIKEMHKVMMENTSDGIGKTPGSFRKNSELDW